MQQNTTRARQGIGERTRSVKIQVRQLDELLLAIEQSNIQMTWLRGKPSRAFHFATLDDKNDFGYCLNNVNNATEQSVVG